MSKTADQCKAAGKKAAGVLPPWARSVKTWAVFGTALAGFYVAAPQVGLQLPRPAFASELRAVEQEMAGSLDVIRDDINTSNTAVTKHLYRLEARSARQDLNRAKVALKRTRRQIIKAVADDEPTGDLRQDETELETEVEELRDDLRRVKVLAQ